VSRNVMGVPKALPGVLVSTIVVAAVAAVAAIAPVAVVGAAVAAAEGPSPADLGREGSGLINLSVYPPAPETYSDEDLHHYQWVLDEKQRAAYASGNEALRRELVRVAFASIDPTPATPENERRKEHFLRLTCARELFYAPFPPWWDDRGELLIRYGAPDARSVNLGGPKDPVREIWIYGRLGLAFELEDMQLSDQFRLTLNRSTKIGRRDATLETPLSVGVPVRPWGFNDPFGTDFRVPDFEARKNARNYRRLVERGAETLAAYPEIYVHDYGGEWLPVAFDAVGFSSDEPGLTRVEIHTGIRAADLTYERRDGLWTASLMVDVVAKTPEYRERARNRKLTLDRRSDVENLQDRLVLDGIDLRLEPGSYRLAIAVRDTTSRRIGTFQRDVEVPAFPEGALAVSGIQTAFRIEPAEPGAPFRKGDLQVAPWPLTKFPRGRDVHLYFEIYGLEPSPTGDRLFSVEMLVQPLGPEKRARTGVGTKWEGRGAGPIVREHFALDTGTIGPGTFDLKITVTDQVGGAVAERSTSVTVSE